MREDNEMNKPYSMIIEEFNQKIIDDINNSGLHISVIDVLFQRIAEKVSLSAQQVAEQEKLAFAENQKESEKELNNEKEGNQNDSK
jgi:hypothetical protein